MAGITAKMGGLYAAMGARRHGTADGALPRGFRRARLCRGRTDVADQEFNFEAEFALLDIGATSSMLRAGCIRPSVLVFTESAGVEAIALDWTDEESRLRALEDARRYARSVGPAAYALIAHVTRNGTAVAYHLPGATASPANEFLAVAMFAVDGASRGVLYPLRRSVETLSFGMPTVVDAGSIDWCPLGDIWANPYCSGDLVRFLPRERAVDPSSPLWTAIVELTRMRIHDDQPNAEEYMAFLDDLRNGLFIVAGRHPHDPHAVLLKPRTIYNPLGTITVAASRILMADPVPADVEQISPASDSHDAHDARAQKVAAR